MDWARPRRLARERGRVQIEGLTLLLCSTSRAAAGRALSPAWGRPVSHQPHQPCVSSCLRSLRRRTQSSWRTRVIAQALLPLLSENDTKGLLIKSMSKTSEGSVWGGRDAPGKSRGRAQGTDDGEGEAAPTAASIMQERSPYAPLDHSLPASPRRMGTATATLARPPRWAVRSAGRLWGLRAFVQHILSARHSVKHLRDG